MTAFARQAAEAHGERLRDYGALRAWSVEHPELFWPALWRFADVRASRPWREVLVERRQDAWREVVRRRRAQFRREPAAAARRPACDHRLDRRWPAAAVELSRAASRGGETRRSSATRGRRPGRSGGGGDAACRPDHHRDAGDDRARRDLVFVLPRFRRAGRARPLRPDRAQGADHDRRLPLQRQADRRAPETRRDRRPPAHARARGVGAVPRSGGAAPGRSPGPSSGTISWCRIPGRSRSRSCRSITPSTFCIRRARQGCPRRSCTAPAARCSSTSRSCCCTRISSPRIAFSTSPPAAG